LEKKLQSYKQNLVKNGIYGQTEIEELCRLKKELLVSDFHSRNKKNLDKKTSNKYKNDHRKNKESSEESSSYSSKGHRSKRSKSRSRSEVKF